MPVIVRLHRPLAKASTDSEAAVVPASVVPLPAFSLLASVLSVADVARAPASPPLECVAVGDRSGESRVGRVAPAAAADDLSLADLHPADSVVDARSAAPQPADH